MSWQWILIEGPIRTCYSRITGDSRSSPCGCIQNQFWLKGTNIKRNQFPLFGWAWVSPGLDKTWLVLGFLLLATLINKTPDQFLNYKLSKQVVEVINDITSTHEEYLKPTPRSYFQLSIYQFNSIMHKLNIPCYRSLLPFQIHHFFLKKQRNNRRIHSKWNGCFLQNKTKLKKVLGRRIAHCMFTNSKQ